MALSTCYVFIFHHIPHQHYCDESMNLLMGKETSLGTLRAIADEVISNGNDMNRMPGKCCFDGPTDHDAFFGLDVRMGVEILPW